MEVIIGEAQEYSHTVSRRSRIGKLRIWVACSGLDVIRQCILNIRPQSNEFRRTESVTREGRSEQGCVIAHETEIEAGRDRMLALGPGQIICGIPRGQALARR